MAKLKVPMAAPEAHAKVPPPSAVDASCAKDGLTRSVDASELHMVSGKYYDLSSFEHPGGELVVKQTRGTDVTALVKSHHFTDAPYRVLEKREVDPCLIEGTIQQTCAYTFEEDGFYETVKRKVVEELGLGRDGVRAPVSALYRARVVLSVVAWAATWLHCCFFPIRMSVVLSCCLLRLVLTGIGHEGIHGRISFSKHLIDLILLFPANKWHYEHVICHHPHCKRIDLDPDETLAFLRLSEKTSWRRYHIVQVLLQGVMSLFMSLAIVIEHHIIGNIDMLQGVGMLVLSQWLPVFTHPDGYKAGLFVYFWVIMVSNMLTLHFLHISHITESVTSSMYDLVEGIDWGEHQMRTTCNWKTTEFSISGMLELQIEHHLFPSLTYAQQRRIRGVVRATAKEFSLPYHEFHSLFHGLRAHIRYMLLLSSEESKATLSPELLQAKQAPVRQADESMPDEKSGSRLRSDSGRRSVARQE